MIKAKAEDKAWIINILSKAFDKNKSVNYIVLQDQKRKKRIEALMEYSFDVCLKFGEIWLSDDRQACGMLLYPDRKKTTFGTILLDIKLIYRAISIFQIAKALKRESNIKSKQPQVKMSYLWFLGVNPESQGKGIGSKLLKDLINREQQNERPIYLETSTPKNLPWYKKFGFKIYDELELGYTLYFLTNQQA